MNTRDILSETDSAKVLGASAHAKRLVVHLQDKASPIKERP